MEVPVYCGDLWCAEDFNRKSFEGFGDDTRYCRVFLAQFDINNPVEAQQIELKMWDLIRDGSDPYVDSNGGVTSRFGVRLLAFDVEGPVATNSPNCYEFTWKWSVIPNTQCQPGEIGDFSFDVGSVNFKQMFSYGSMCWFVNDLGATVGPVTNNGMWIGADCQFEGCDAQAAQIIAKLPVCYPGNVLTAALLDELALTVGTTNIDPWQGFGADVLCFLGGQTQYVQPQNGPNGVPIAGDQTNVTWCFLLDPQVNVDVLMSNGEYVSIAKAPHTKIFPQDRHCSFDANGRPVYSVSQVCEHIIKRQSNYPGVFGI